MRTLTLRELNRALLGRQLLLQRQRLSVTNAVERVAGLQAQWPPSPYLGLWSRLDGFAPDQLTRAVARRTVVKATLMRTTLHIVSAADYLAYAGIYRRSRIHALELQLAALGERIALARKRRRMTQLTLGVRVGISVPTLRKLEQGDAGVSMAAFLRVLQVLGLAADIDRLAADDELGRRLQDVHQKGPPRGRRLG